MSTLSRERPGDNTRWVDPSAFLKPTLSDGVPNWLGEEWAKAINKKEGGGKYDWMGRYPSVYEIMLGIQEQEKLNQREIHKLQKNKEYVNALIENMLHIWKHIFDAAIHQDKNKQITGEELADPKSAISCGLLYIYSMETFIYSALNSASRDHDKTKIFTLGPLSRALNETVVYAECSRPEDSESLPT